MMKCVSRISLLSLSFFFSPAPLFSNNKKKIAEVIRHLLDDYEQLLPTVLEIPSKDHPYDSSKDGIMQRIKRMLGQD